MTVAIMMSEPLKSQCQEKGLRLHCALIATIQLYQLARVCSEIMLRTRRSLRLQLYHYPFLSFLFPPVLTS